MILCSDLHTVGSLNHWHGQQDDLGLLPSETTGDLVVVLFL